MHLAARCRCVPVTSNVRRLMQCRWSGSMNRTTFLVLVALTIPASSFACTCEGPKHIVEAARNSSFLARVQIVSHRSTSAGQMQTSARILEVYKGTEKASEIGIFSDSANCFLAYVPSVPVGTEWVMSLSPDAQEGYILSGCGVHWLQVVDGLAVGQISRDQSDQKMSRRDLRNLLGRSRR